MSLSLNSHLGRYNIRSLLGAGGMGEVYLAEDRRLRRKVALKLLPANFSANQDRLARFEREAYAASSLNHPNILTIYEIGEAEGHHFIVTEFIEGESLRQRIGRARLELRESLSIGVQVASALAAAHAAGIIHRDIKPENVMTRTDGIVKVLDFGLAKFVEHETSAPDTKAPTRDLYKTAAGIVMGTVNYMSPEQARAQDVDARTDVWSLGVVLYEMLTGRQPFTGETVTDVLASILRSDAEPPRAFAAAVPPELDRIVLKSLSKDREKRYRSAQDLLVDLRQLQKRLEFEAELERTGATGKAIGSGQSEGARQTLDRAPLRSGDKASSDSGTLIDAPASVPSNNLSTQGAMLVGREKEIEEIAQALRRDDVRLLTLTGVGGTGKTTLARAVARALLTEFTDGLFLVELAAITSSELVAQTIAQPLGVKEAGGRPIVEVLKDYLCEREMLLVVDNFEQVTSAAPVLAELLSAAPKLKVLVTSRALLHLSAELEYAVPPLTVPDNLAPDLADELLRYEAVRLFVERARSAKRSFALTTENARIVAEICSRLDGLPLAIELAAARVRVLSPQAILTKLEHRLKLLTGGARDLPARQQTIRGTVEWSYDLLTEDEKLLFRRLAVFAGGWRFEAAEAVVGASVSAVVEERESDALTDGSDRQLTIDVLEGITSLVNKSLLAQKEQADGEPRFRMLAVVREYALEALAASGEAEKLRRSHAAYFVALGEEAEPHLQAAQSAEWLNRLEEEHDNLRAALAWSAEHDALMAARLAAAIRSFWSRHSHITEGRGWLQAALEGLPSDAPDALRLKLLNGLGLAARQQGDYKTSRKVYEEGLAAGGRIGDKRQVALSNRGLGLVAHCEGDYDAARKFFEEGLRISRDLNDKFGMAASLNFLGDLARTEGDFATARPLFEESLAITRELGNKEAVASNLNNLGAIAYGEGDFAASRAHFTEALAMARELGHKSQISFSLDGFGALSANRGDVERATQLAGAAEHLRESVGYEIDPAERRFRDAYLAELRTALAEAAFSDLYEQGCKLKTDEALALALAGHQDA